MFIEFKKIDGTRVLINRNAVAAVSPIDHNDESTRLFALVGTSNYVLSFDVAMPYADVARLLTGQENST